MKHPEHIAGTKDYLGSDARRLVEIADACTSTFDLYGYARVILPILERSDIFLQRSGEEIRSRMYIFTDPKGRTEICLRPEMTISVARAFLERMAFRRLPVRLSYQGDVFRYDKVREGRYRQFLQAGVELIGSENRLAADVEVTTLALEAVKQAGIADFRLLLGDLELAAEFINSLPVSAAVGARLLENFWRREAFHLLLNRLSESAPQGKLSSDATAAELEKILSSLGENAGRLLVRQILSLFVEKEIGHRDLDEIAERFLQRFTAGQEMGLPKDCAEAVQEYLSIAGPPDAALQQLEKLLQRIGATPGPAFEAAHARVELLQRRGVLPARAEIDLGFRRGIEYYTGFIFEIHCDYLGPVSQVCGGGRYDGLLSALGAPQQIPAVGFALGVDRLLLAIDKAGTSLKPRPGHSVDALAVSIGQVPQETVWRIAQICRAAGWRVRAEFDYRRLKEILGHASEEEIPYVIIIGEDEMRDQCVKVKDMAGRKEEIVAIDQLDGYVRAAIERAHQNNHERP